MFKFLFRTRGCDATKRAFFIVALIDYLGNRNNRRYVLNIKRIQQQFNLFVCEQSLKHPALVGKKYLQHLDIDCFTDTVYNDIEELAFAIAVCSPKWLTYGGATSKMVDDVRAVLLYLKVVP